MRGDGGAAFPSGCSLSPLHCLPVGRGESALASPSAGCLWRVLRGLAHTPRFLFQDIDWVQTEKHVFEQASSNPFLVGLHSCFQTTSR